MKNKEQEAIKAEILQEKMEVEKELKKSIIECIDKIKKYNPYMLYSHILHHYKMIQLMPSEGNDGIKIEIKICLKYFQMLITCISEDEFQDCELKEQDFLEILEKLKNISNNIFQVILCISFELDNKYSDDEQEYIRDNFLMKNVSGKRYDFFELEHYKNLFTPLKEQFKESFNFEVESLYDGIGELKEEFTRGLNSAIEEFAVYMDNNDLEKIKNDKNKIQEGNEIFQRMLGLESHNVKKITKWPINFIQLFTFNLGDNKEFIKDINLFTFLELERLIKIKPFIRIGDEYYCILIQEFLDNFDRRIIKEICAKNPDKEAQEIRKIHTKNIEIITEKMFKSILPNSKSYIGNYYKYNGGIAENDLIVIYDQNLIIVEIKAGSYTPDLAFSNMESHLKTLEDLIQKGSEQSQRLYEILKKEKQIDLYDGNNKTKKVKCTLNFNDYDNIYKIIITQENFNELEAKAEKIGLIKVNEETIVLSLDDLMVYSDYFKNEPSRFFHYLKQRFIATQNDNIKLFDELDHLGLYIEHNVYSLTIDEMKNSNPAVTNILIDGYREELDKYYADKYLKDRCVIKPEKKLPDRIQEIINFCDLFEPENHINFTNEILDYATEEKETINAKIEEMIKFYKDYHRGKYFCMFGDINTFIFVVYDDENYEMLNLFKEEAYANMIINNIEKMSFCGIYYDKYKKIKNMIIYKLDINKDKYDREKCEKIAVEIAEKRLKRELLNRKKIGRNDKCPCGSGKKYKKCCLNKSNLDI